MKVICGVGDQVPFIQASVRLAFATLRACVNS
jgi:hypothetical protein